MHGAVFLLGTHLCFCAQKGKMFCFQLVSSPMADPFEVNGLKSRHSGAWTAINGESHWKWISPLSCTDVFVGVYEELCVHLPPSCVAEHIRCCCILVPWRAVCFMLAATSKMHNQAADNLTYYFWTQLSKCESRVAKNIGASQEIPGSNLTLARS